MQYRYKCTVCQMEQDIDHKITESPEIKCPKCGGLCVRVITGGNGFVFKCGGFYSTDYRKVK